ncbi:hypothetical protein ACQEVB_01385 [Pseudonocardia sp. CA-107938]|uniref:hypothetical protein n=1 Tax=Pseudonocardia sp. CA-107938 TaxID=3240021 RepID=UPI003D94DF39
MVRRRPERGHHVPLRSAAFTRVESGPDGDWYVRTVTGTAAAKDYRCPGCDQVIARGIAHVVVWSAEEHGSLADRRHWHSPCWAARLRRRPGRH